MSERQTIGTLLNYIEKIAWHPPDPAECDCHMCNVWGTVIHLSNSMSKPKEN